MAAQLGDTIDASLVNGQLCLFRPDTFALCVLNPTAAKIWQGLCAHKPLGEIARDLVREHAIPKATARADVAATIRNWRRAGLLAACPENPSQFSAPTTASPVGGDAPPPSEATTSLGHFGLGGSSVIAITCDEPVLSGLLGAVLAPLRTDLEADTELNIRARELRTAEPTYRVERNGETIAAELTRAGARSLTLYTVLESLIGAENCGAVIHGAGLVKNGHAFVLAGKSGSGKSTLAACLLKRGFGYLADDLAPLCRDGKSLLSFPLALAAKQGSWSTLRRFYPELESLPILQTRHIAVRYLPPPSSPAAGTADQFVPLPIDSVIFPQFEQGAALDVEPLEPEDVFCRLIATGSLPSGRPAKIGPLCRLANERPGFRLRYGDVGTAAAFIDMLSAP